MKLVRGGARPNDELSNDEFEWREIRRSNREEAEAEARRQQELDDAAEVEWIYLRNKRGEWVARRTPRDAESYAKPTGCLSALRDAFVQSFVP
jgi:hypothetical protein